MNFAAESDLAEIEMWEKTLPDVEDGDEKTEPEDLKEFDETKLPNSTEKGRKSPKNASVLYFDLFKKKMYSKTLIFQKENEIYRLVGFCEAPMS